jgi:hypothetical protein
MCEKHINTLTTRSVHHSNMSYAPTDEVVHCLLSHIHIHSARLELVNGAHHDVCLPPRGIQDTMPPRAREKVATGLKVIQNSLLEPPWTHLGATKNPSHL